MTTVPYNKPIRLPRALLWFCLLASGVAAIPDLDAVTLKELTDNQGLNAKKFASYFGEFSYEFNTDIQPASVFLTREKGDCDDYSVLADFVLRRKGFGTRLIHIRLAGRVAHAVCYVSENKAYLDYNNRNVFFTLARCSPDIREIAAKVADSLEASWTSASEFTYSYETRRKTMIATVSQAGESGSDRNHPAPSAFHVD